MFDNFFGTNESRFLLDTVLCLIVGYAIGAERESRGKDAGISTHMFVIFGAMLFTFLSATVDPNSKSRIAAQIVTGIGFLGAGLILKDGVVVRNLTTAASIWFAASIGMAIGFGYDFIAIVATLVSLIIPRVPHINKYYDERKKPALRKSQSSESSERGPEDQTNSV